MSRLLDVNVLVALGWPNHVHHAAARNWFDEYADQGWATTPITEAGFVRLSSNRVVAATSTTPQIAIDLLKSMTGQGEHEFWPDDVRFVTGADGERVARLRGHHQVTDAHLLTLVDRRRGRLATLDGAMVDLDLNRRVDLIPVKD